MITGSCLCGSVAFEVEGPMRHAIACHCIQCRKTTGHYWSATSAPKDAITLTRDTTLTWFESSDFARRGFCNACGASLFYERPATGTVAIGMGCLDAPTGLREAEHIFTADKGDYYDLPDNITESTRWPDHAPAVPKGQR